MAKILVADDDAYSRLLLVTILVPQGHSVIEAGDGREALRLGASERPDLIIVDLHMPGMGGVELVNALRADVGNAATIVLYTATSEGPALSRFLEDAAITHIIPKPSLPDDILRIIAGALAAS